MSPRRARPKRLDYERLQQRVVALHEAVRTREALAIHRKILPDENPHALGLFGRIASRYHAFPMAVRLLERSIERGCDDGNDFNDLGLARLGAGRLEEALHAFEEAARRDPADHRAPVNVGVVLQQQGMLDEALAQFERVAELHPAEPAVTLRRAELRLRRGEPADAVALLEELRAHGLHPTWPLALEAVAHAELGDEAAFRSLMRFADFVQELEAAPPAGFPDLPSFHAQLRNHVARQRGLVRDPDGFSTRNGLHTLGNLLRDRSEIVLALEAQIHRAIRQYLEALPEGGGHPFLDARERAADFRVGAWAVLLERQGYHEAHVHRDGWVSGVYYLRVGDVVGDDGECEGWLELGQGPEELHGLGSASWTRRVRPRDGLFVLFPSYCWHRTLPFSAEGQRAAVAFDVIPRG